jgi:hypothetical protein
MQGPVILRGGNAAREAEGVSTFARYIGETGHTPLRMSGSLPLRRRARLANLAAPPPPQPPAYRATVIVMLSCSRWAA